MMNDRSDATGALKATKIGTVTMIPRGEAIRLGLIST
jgi:hypothetical protein